MGLSSRLRATLLVLLILAAAVFVAVFVGRDLPRRWLEAKLADASDAEVHLGGLRIHSLEHVELVDLVVEKPAAYPGLRRFEVVRVDVIATLDELRAGSIRQLHLTGALAVLEEAVLDEAPPAPAAGDEAAFEIRRLVAPDLHLRTFLGGDEPAEGSLDVSLWYVDGSWIGSVDLEAEAVELSPFVAAFGWSDLSARAHDLEARVRLSAPPGLDRTDIRARRLFVHHRPSELDFTFAEPRFAGRDLPPSRGELEAARLEIDTEASHGTAARFPELRVELAVSGDGLHADATSAVFDAFEFELVSGEPRASCRALRLADARVTGFGVERLEGVADIDVAGSFTRPEIDIDARLEASALANGPHFSHRGAKLDVSFTPELAASEESAGRWPLELSLDLPKVDSPDLLRQLAALPPLTARFAGHFEPRRAEIDAHPAFDGRGRIETAKLELGLAGVLPLDPRRDPASLRWRLDAGLASLLEVASVAPSTFGPVAGRISARGSCSGTLVAPRIAGDVELRELRAEIEQWALGGEFKAQGFEVAATEGGGGWRLDVSKLEGLAEIESAHFPALTVDVDGELDAAIGEGGLRRLDLRRLDAGLGEGAELGRLELRGRLRGGSAGEIADLALKVRTEADLATWQRSLAVGLGGVEVRGRADLDIEIAGTPRGDGTGVGVGVGIGDFTADGTLELHELGASAAAGARVLEGLETRLDLAASTDETGRIEAQASGELGGFLVLWDAYFGDLSELESTLEAHFSRPGDGSENWAATLELTPQTAKQATHLAFELAQEDRRLDVRGTARSEDLEDLLVGLLRPFQTEDPALQELHGGAHLEVGLETALEAGPADAVRLHGRLETWDTSARLWQIAVNGLELDVPFDLRRVGDEISGPPLAGSLRMASSRAMDLKLPPIASKLRISGDDVALEEALEIELLGGRLGLERLTARDLLVAPRAESGLRLEELSIERLTRSLGLPELEGRLDGTLPRVAVDGERLQVDGGGRMQLFGGEIRLRDITGKEIFTRFPRFRLSADIDELELGRLTRRFDFGEMQGAISGTIDECVLVGGAPVAFDARFESVEKKGIRQTVDVKAVQNLTILGTGGSPTFFDRGLQRFLKRYRYKKLGIAVELRDDMLELRGLVKEGERELFLQGGLFFGIDIVNAVPGQRVSYSTMMRRLENLDLESVRTD